MTTTGALALLFAVLCVWPGFLFGLGVFIGRRRLRVRLPFRSPLVRGDSDTGYGE